MLLTIQYTTNLKEFNDNGDFFAREYSFDKFSEKTGTYTLNTENEILSLEYDSIIVRYQIVLVMDQILLMKVTK